MQGYLAQEIVQDQLFDRLSKNGLIKETEDDVFEALTLSQLKAMITEVVTEAKKGPSKKTQKKAAKSFVKGTKTFTDKVKKAHWADNPAAMAGWMMKTAGKKD